MKKTMLLIGLLVVISLATRSQENSKFSGPIFFSGRVIQIHRLPAGGFGYDILQQNRIVVHQDRNPFTGLPQGLKTEQDAIKVAKWQSAHLGSTEHPAATNEHTIPKDVARQLNIATN